MIAQHTITHAIQYLLDAAKAQRECLMAISDAAGLYLVEPQKPCAAYGLAKRTLKRCGSLAGAIADLEKQLEEA